MLIYLHGFNSSPESRKARSLQHALASLGWAERFACPALPHWPADAIAAAESIIRARANEAVCLVGSSLGGFYATHLAEKHGLKAALINPAIDPHIGLRAYLGPQQNLYTGERYQLTQAHLDEWARQYVSHVTPAHYLLIVETGDEVLDYRHALDRYRGAQQIVIEGGDHSLQSFPEHIPRLLEFAGLRA